MGAILTYQSELLNPLDRCDRCVATAKVRAVFRDQSELLFCVHHFRQHETRLVQAADVVQFDVPLARSLPTEDGRQGAP
jgi:hypothetical protein